MPPQLNGYNTPLLRKSLIRYISLNMVHNRANIHHILCFVNIKKQIGIKIGINFIIFVPFNNFQNVKIFPQRNRITQSPPKRQTVGSIPAGKAKKRLFARAISLFFCFPQEQLFGGVAFSIDFFILNVYNKYIPHFFFIIKQGESRFANLIYFCYKGYNFGSIISNPFAIPLWQK